MMVAEALGALRSRAPVIVTNEVSTARAFIGRPPKAPAKNMGLVMFYVPPHVVLEPGSHETEETYVVIEGRGRMTSTNFQRDVTKGDFVHLPPWCEHGIENTGTETLVVLIATSPPNP